MKSHLGKSDIQDITEGKIKDPFLLLGPHKIDAPNGEVILIRSYLPEAKGAKIISQKYTPAIYQMERLPNTDIFETVTDQKEFFPYKIEVEWKEGGKDIAYDPYSFPPTINEDKQKRFKEGKDYYTYQTLGAHRVKINGIDGVSFALWAPEAGRVSVVGDFNSWEGRRYMMRLLGESGIWEIFIPGLKEGERYKFELKTRGGEIYIKSDPYARCTELWPETASIISNTDDWEWGDKKWLEKRKDIVLTKKSLSIYEAGLDHWSINKDGGALLNYREMAHLLAKHAKKIGCTHIKLMPLQEGPIAGYFSPSGQFGSPEDFLYFVDHLHRHNIGVIMNWSLAGGFPADEDGLSFLISNILFWLREYHIDGISILSANHENKEEGNKNLGAEGFLKEFNMAIQDEFPDIITITKKTTPQPE